MTNAESAAVSKALNIADQIAAITSLMAQLFASDPDQTREAAAMEGISSMARLIEAELAPISE